MLATQITGRAGSPGMLPSASHRGCTHRQLVTPRLTLQALSAKRRGPHQPAQGIQQRHLCRRRQQLLVSADGAIVPDVPFPGDDQASIIFTALSEVERSAASVIERAEERLARSAADSASRLSSESGASTAAVDANGAARSNGASPGSQQKPPKVPHRWVIVGAMALAFVLCNMDKVRPGFAQLPPCCTPPFVDCFPPRPACAR